MAHGSRARTLLRTLARVVLVLVLVVVAAIGVVILGANLPVGHRFIAGRVTSLLASTFQGSVRVESISGIGPGGVQGVRVRVLDPEGSLVLLASGASVRLSTFALIESLFGKGLLQVTLAGARVDHVDVSLDSAPDGQLRLLRAFALRRPGNEPPPGSKPSRGVHFKLAHVELPSSWVHGKPGGAPPLDVTMTGLSGSLDLTPARTTLAVHGVDLRTRGMPQHADVEGHLSFDLDAPKAASVPDLKGELTGDLAGSPIVVSGSLVRQRVTGRLDATITRDSARKLLPDVALLEPVIVGGSVEGTLPELAATMTVNAGKNRVALGGQVRTLAPLEATARAEAHHVDLSALLGQAPRTDLGAAVVGSLTSGDGVVRAAVDVETSSGSVAGQPIPGATVHATLGDSGLDATALVRIPGAPTRLSVSLKPADPGSPGRFQLVSDVRNLHAVPFIGETSEGRAHIDVAGTLGLRPPVVHATGKVEAWDARVSSARARHATLDLEVSGAVADPFLSARARAEGVNVADQELASVTASLRGRRSGADVEASLSGRGNEYGIEAGGRVELEPGVRLLAPVVSVRRGGVRASAQASEVLIRPQAIRVTGAVVRGLGEPIHAELAFSRASPRVRVDSPDLDLARAGKLLGLGTPLRGRASLAVDLTERRSVATGLVDVNVEGAAMGRMPPTDARLHLALNSRRITGKLEARSGPSHLYLVLQELELAGPVYRVMSWTGATGAARVDADLALARAGELLGEAPPFSGLAGTLRATADIVRATPDRTPRLSLHASTLGLALTRRGKREPRFAGVEVEGPPAFRTSGVDLELDLKTDDHDGTDAAARLFDPKGTLISAHVELRLPLQSLVREPRAMASALLDAPFRAEVEVPTRDLHELPEALATRRMNGWLSMHATAEGTANEPRIAVEGALERFAMRRGGRAAPMDVRLSGKYERARANLSVEVAEPAPRNARLLHLDSELRMEVGELLRARKAIRWDLEVRGQAEGFPLQTLWALGETRIGGALSGTLTARAGTSGPPKVDANLEVLGMKLGRTKGGHVRAKVTLDAAHLSTALEADIQGGSLRASGNIPLRFVGPLRPELDDGRPFDLSVEARRFRAEALEPFAGATVQGLKGRIDAQLHVEDGLRHPALEGQLSIADGRFELPAIGEEFRKARAEVVFKGDGVIEAPKISAEGLSGKVVATARARMNGLELVDAKVEARIPRKDPLPITIQGQSLAEAWGTVRLEAVRHPGSPDIDLTVDVPRAGVRLPEKSSHALQELAPSEKLRMGVRRRAGEFVILPMAPPNDAEKGAGGASIKTTVRLHDVEVTRGTDLRVRLEGNTVVQSGEKASVTGKITLRSGFLDVQGKRFEIERGTITFVGEPDDPEVVVTAGWTAPDGTRVLADFVGPLRTGKVTLRSEPTHTQSEILALILFGTADGAAVQSSSTSAGNAGVSAALGVAGGVATRGLNRALDDLTGLDVTARIDTAAGANPRPEVEVRLARDISLSLAHVLGVPPPGTNPDRNLAILNWRFERNWSVETTFGDEGSSMLDLVWQYRY